MYISSENAVLYFEGRYPNPTGWNSATSINRTRALTTASRFLDRLNYVGEKLSDEQEHEFPRTGQAEIPLDLQYACAEIAESLLSGYDPEEEFDNLTVVAQGISSARVTYDRNQIPEGSVMGIPSAVAWRYIKPWLKDNKNIRIRRV
jgi:hypothetical protein